MVVEEVIVVRDKNGFSTEARTWQGSTLILVAN